MQVELLNRHPWRTNLELAIAIADYIEHFYNPSRRHSSLGYLTPNEFERLQSPSIPPTRASPYCCVAALVRPPTGREGRPSKALSLEQA
jgi:hypothetical protein